MSSTAIAAVRLAQVQDPGPALSADAGQTALPPSGRADQRDLDLFNLAMREPLPRSPLSAAGAAPLRALSDYFRDRGQALASQMARVQATRDPAAMLRVTNELIDLGVQNDLLAKVVGKSVSAVDQLTKLS
ncbi:EscI/YscI/HrpB family type III secretion system inner rod protein [Duganella violaceipulchra]|uniref:EscI/YscI/HrpB family type III secretion system inner rod protein n=1 Tax=Duganella violaceipulchra TaxID=2849652 RepID=A0AA41H5Y9_9BURK|nr:EscI/YscI/HrpB family type III secretion system inner rod protein [Duganella violaceicalia]MBV6322458.1 EscI/YscI/HrpB family type III secretion system inner rod protein [Duganella violaceicalia]MCP2010663.1 type III secretion system YscI/HrpB-like protein [Duganella violaceicalia]